MSILSILIPKAYVIDSYEEIYASIMKMSSHISCAFLQKGIAITSIHDFGRSYLNTVPLETAKKIRSDYFTKFLKISD